MANLKLRDARKIYGALEVIKGIDLDVDDREFVVFVGPSGCGKSTLLRMIAGLEKITGGDLMIDGTRANDVDPSQRGLAMVFQSYALYPHMTVAENMGFALKIAGVSPTERDRKVRRLPRFLSSRISLTVGRRICRVGSGNVWPSAGRSCAIRRSSSSTSPCPISMRLCASTCGWS